LKPSPCATESASLKAVTNLKKDYGVAVPEIFAGFDRGHDETGRFTGQNEVPKKLPIIGAKYLFRLCIMALQAGDQRWNILSYPDQIGIGLQAYDDAISPPFLHAPPPS